MKRTRTLPQFPLSGTYRTRYYEMDDSLSKCILEQLDGLEEVQVEKMVDNLKDYAFDNTNFSTEPQKLDRISKITEYSDPMHRWAFQLEGNYSGICDFSFRDRLRILETIEKLYKE